MDLDNSDYIEYTSPAGGEGLAIERQGTGFFKKAVDDTLPRISAEDRERFLRWFSRENLAKAADTKGISSVIFRLMDRDSPMHVSMKVTRVKGTNRIILGVSIIDSQA